MKKYFSLVTVSLIALAMLLTMPVKVFAASTADSTDLFDLNKTNQLTVAYKSADADLNGTEISLYRVAEWSDRYDLTLTEAFADCGFDPEKVESTDEWDNIGDTLDSYVQANSPAAYATQKVSSDKVVFSDLPVGIYFIPELTIVEENGIRTFSRVLLHLPEYSQNEYGEFDWQTEIKSAPKSESYTPTYKDVEYFINVVWDDKGYESNRPSSVDASIFKNGELSETVAITADGSWHYSWVTKDDGTEWNVNGSEVPKYTLTVKQVENGWILEYHFIAPDPVPPRTGESFPWLAVILLSVSGMALVAVGLISRRRVNG